MEVSKDPLDEGYKLIDQGKYSEAIQELQSLSLRDFRPSVKVALASAYAARGDIRVEHYWGFVIGFATPLVSSESSLESSHIESLQKIIKETHHRDANRQDLQALEDLMEAATVWDQYKNRLDAIPSVSGEALMDLKSAVDILGGVQTPGGRLYRAILNLILFKSYITASGGFWLDYNKVIEQVLRGENQVLCQFNFKELLKWLVPISFHLMETLEDLTFAFPENRKDLESARDLIQVIYNKTKDAVEELHKKRSCP
ncbi:MAG TPA: hypothetical protein VIG33_04395 [Pseudobdellovibrionaceae bacterium]